MRLHRNPMAACLSALLMLVTLSGCGFTPSMSASGTDTSLSAEARKRRPVRPTDEPRVFRVLQGQIVTILPDDTNGLKHQLFRFKVSNGTLSGDVVQCAYNMDLAPYLPLRVGKVVEIKGEFIDTDPYDVIHWTHHDPKGGEGGYVKIDGKIYQ